MWSVFLRFSRLTFDRLTAGQTSRYSLLRSYGSMAPPMKIREPACPVTIPNNAVAVLAAALLGFAFSPAWAAERPLHIVALGDSLTAGYGLRPGEAFPAVLQRALAARGIAAQIFNAGASGDTSSGGLARLDWSVPDGTDAVIVELGANDALRGLDPAVTRAALEGILRRLKARKIAVLLCGMLAPPNLGADYGRAFNAIYGDLAAQYDAILYPFFLDGVVADPKLNQADGLHPTAEGVGVIVKAILPKVEALIAKVRPGATPSR
jgi:acyl-CoA thioesterase I